MTARKWNLSLLSSLLGLVLCGSVSSLAQPFGPSPAFHRDLQTAPDAETFRDKIGVSGGVGTNGLSPGSSQFVITNETFYLKAGAPVTNLTFPTELTDRVMVIFSNGAAGAHPTVTLDLLSFIQNLSADAQGQLNVRITTNNGSAFNLSFPALTPGVMVLGTNGVVATSPVTSSELSHSANLIQNIQDTFNGLTPASGGGSLALTNFAALALFPQIENQIEYSVVDNGTWHRRSNNGVTNAVTRVPSLVFTQYLSELVNPYEFAIQDDVDLGGVGVDVGLTNSIHYQIQTNGASIRRNLPVVEIDAGFVTDLETFPLHFGADTIARVSGFSSVGDGGEGLFYLKSGLSTNMGTVFASVDPTLSWQRIYDKDRILWSWWNPDATGATDARNKLQDAVSQAHEDGHGSLIITPGDFKIESTLPIFMGEMNLIGGGGKLWNSLPSDYVDTRDYTTNQFYTKTGVLNFFRTNTTYTSATRQMPWNGKTEMFKGLTNGIVANIKVDGGWGTTDAPAGVIPISGVGKDPSFAEFIFYQIFNSSYNVNFTGCEMSNSAGAAIEVGDNVIVDHCQFTEFGDHVFYMRGDTGNHVFSNNAIIALRPSSGVAGTPPYDVTPPAAGSLFATHRDAIKLRGVNDTVIAGNSMQSIEAIFVTVEAVPVITPIEEWTNIERVSITDNTFKGTQFLQLTTGRRTSETEDVSTPAPTDGMKIKGLTVTGNTIELNTGDVSGGGKVINGGNGTFAFVGVAMDGFKFSDNVVRGQYQLKLFGNEEYLISVTNAIISDNIFSGGFDEGPLISLGGKIEHLIISGNDYIATNVNHGNNQTLLGSQYNFKGNFKKLIVSGNRLQNCYAIWKDNASSGSVYAPIYDNGTTYNSTNLVYDDFTFDPQQVIVRSAVDDDLYINNITTTGGGDPSSNANWDAYTIPENQLYVFDNYRFTQSTALAVGTRVSQLVDIAGNAGDEHKYTWVIVRNGNQHQGLVGDTEAYGFKSIGDGVISEVALGNLSASFASLQDATVTDNFTGPSIFSRVSDNRVAIGAGHLTPFAALDVKSSLILMGADFDSSDERTPAVEKRFRIGVANFATTSTNTFGTPFIAFNTRTTAAENIVAFGGSGDGFAPTDFQIYTAANNTTTTGTLRWEVNEAGNLLPGADNSYNFGSDARKIASIVYGSKIFMGGTSGPTITFGTGVPGTTEPNGSTFHRSDGTGPNLYVRENGVWVSK